MFTESDPGKVQIRMEAEQLYQNIGQLLTVHLESPEFLIKLAKTFGNVDFTDPKNIDTVLGYQENKDKKPDVKETFDPDLAEKVEWLRKKVEGLNPSRSNLLKITVQSHSPIISQKIASQAMELFIQTLLNAEIQRIEAKLDFLRGVMVGPEKTKDLSQGNQILSTLPPEQKFREIKDDLQQLVKLKTTQLENLIADRNQRRVSLQSDLDRMLSSLQPNHPDVIAKEAQLAKMQVNSEEVQALIQEISTLRSRLWDLKASQLQNSNFKDISDGILDIDDNQKNSFFYRISENIERLRIELKDLEIQVRQPSLRIRLRVLRTASYEPIPAMNNKLLSGIFAFILTNLLALAIMVVREILFPKTHDSWRVENDVDVPVIGKLSRSSVEKIGPIDAHLIHRVGQDGGRGVKREFSNIKVGVEEYRKIALGIHRQCRGKVICILEAGGNPFLTEAIGSFINVYATETPGKTIVLDLNSQSPISNDRGLPIEEYESIVTHSSQLAKIVIASDNSRSFDLLPPPIDRFRSGSDLLSHSRLTKLFNRMAESYDTVFVRGFEEGLLLENASILSAASDAVLIVESSKVPMSDLKNLLYNFGTNKIRGLIIKGE